MNIAFVSYETLFAPCGGIAAVMGRLPGRVAAAARTRTIGITPFHHRIEKTTSLPRSHEGSVGVSFEGRSILVNIYRHDTQVPWYFLQPEDPQFFAGAQHPYQVSAADLMRDALFFGVAAARALPIIEPGARWNLLLQDWEASTTALGFAGHPGTHRCYLTLHNSYDAVPSPDDLLKAGINPALCPGHTLLQRALGLCEPPVFTVSDQFAADFLEDVLQSQVLAPHLRDILRNRILGIDNGPFADLAVPADALGEASSGRPAALREWKGSHRDGFLQAFANFTPHGDQVVWGDAARFAGKADLPWFVMAGRDDSRQKGYDVAVRAVTQFLEAGGQAQFLFFPIPGDEGREGLRFLQRLAERFPESVAAFPFVFREGFLSALRGAAFGLMPSLYEPFGMANEFYLNGTACIGRATGGLAQQVVPFRAAACFGKAVQRRTERWASPSAFPTGLLFRERDRLPTEPADWRGINSGLHTAGAPGEDRVEHRLRYPLFRSMADELTRALHDAVRLCATQPALYDAMLTSGIGHIARSFSWDRAACEYVRHLEM